MALERSDHLAGWSWIVVLPSTMHNLVVSRMDPKGPKYRAILRISESLDRIRYYSTRTDCLI
jgi:hypothetical protein